MYSLNTDLDLIELNHIFGSNYKVLKELSGECYILSDYGEYAYNECFEYTDNAFFQKQMYEKALPYRGIKFYDFYLIELVEEKGVWYRGRKDTSGNIELTCYSDSLTEAYEGL